MKRGNMVLVVIICLYALFSAYMFYAIQTTGTTSCIVTATNLHWGATAPNGDVSCSNGQSYKDVPSSIKQTCAIRVGDHVTITFYIAFPTTITGDSNC